MPRSTRLWPALGVWSHLAAILMLGTVVLFCYLNTLRDTGFALDNKFIILGDPRLRTFNLDDPAQRQVTVRNLELILTKDYWWPTAASGLHRPLTTLSYLVNYAVLGNGNHAAGYHAVNLGLHWLAAVLAYFLVLVLMGRWGPAILCSGLFAAHPIATESVANIIGRADLLATVSVLGGFLCYAKSTVMQGRRKAPWLAMLTLITTLGVFCKENAVVVIGVIGLYDLTYRWPNLRFGSIGSFAWDYCSGYLALVPPIAAMAYARTVVLGAMRTPELPFVDNPLIVCDFWTARLTAIKVIGKYLWLLVWPQALSCDYSFNQIPKVDWPFRSWEDWKTLVALVVISTALGLALRSFRRNKPVFFFILFSIGTFLPTSNLFPKLGEPLLQKESWVIGSIMAERFLYLPSIGFVGCLVIAVHSFFGWAFERSALPDCSRQFWLRSAAPTVLGSIIALYGTRTFVRNFDWENDVALWSAAVKVCPDSFKTHKSLAYALYEQDPAGGTIDRVIEEGERALQITDRTVIVFMHLGTYYRIKGDTLAKRTPEGSLRPTKASLPYYEKSFQTLSQAVPLDREFNDDNRRKELNRGRQPDRIPDVGNPRLYRNLGLSALRLGRYDRARDAYLYMRHLAPSNPDAYLGLASTYIAQGEQSQRAIALLQTLLLDNNRADARQMLVKLYRHIDPDGCSVITAPGPVRPSLNPNCPLVREHVRSALLGLVEAFVEAKQPELAKQTRDKALKNYGVAAETFQKLLPDAPTLSTAPDSAQAPGGDDAPFDPNLPAAR